MSINLEGKHAKGILFVQPRPEAPFAISFSEVIYPLQLAAPIALATKHLGIGITASTSFEHPYTFARRLSTADHHTKGRVGWNIVTSYLKSGAKHERCWTGASGISRALLA